MKKLIGLIAIVMSMNAAAQEPTYQVSKDPQNSQIVFKGPVTFADLEGESTFSWLKQGRDEYEYDEKTATKLQTRLAVLGDKVTFVIFLGTWCSDSHDMIPRLQKVLQRIEFPVARVKMYGLDRQKKTKGGEEKQYKIINVPTVIVLEDGRERGRITETVKKSVEADLLRIVQ